ICISAYRQGQTWQTLTNFFPPTQLCEMYSCKTPAFSNSDLPPTTQLCQPWSIALHLRISMPYNANISHLKLESPSQQLQGCPILNTVPTFSTGDHPGRYLAAEGDLRCKGGSSTAMWLPPWPICSLPVCSNGPRHPSRHSGADMLA
uniref:Uncharacterized protein n=1 Tax=Gopherus agassizii TaxID=38772 RepID=A0A452ID50_9SAUR